MSVSSILSIHFPPFFLAYRWLSSAVRRPPRWSAPVGEGAKRRRGAMASRRDEGKSDAVGTRDRVCLLPGDDELARPTLSTKRRTPNGDHERRPLRAPRRGHPRRRDAVTSVLLRRRAVLGHRHLHQHPHSSDSRPALGFPVPPQECALYQLCTSIPPAYIPSHPSHCGTPPPVPLEWRRPIYLQERPHRKLAPSS